MNEPLNQRDPQALGGAFAEFLEANRATINQDVAAVVRQASGFDAEVFADALRTSVAPIVDAVDALGQGFVGVVSQVLVRVALDLSAQRRFEGAVRAGWDRLLPRLAAQLAVDPQRVIAAVTNALVTLDRADSGRPEQWIDLMVEAAPLAPDVDDLLAAGQVAAWRSGMAAYRRDALTVAADLDLDLVAAALGLPADGSEAGASLARLRDDPWFDPASPAPTEVDVPRPPVAVGSFRGFGGPFLRPPMIAAADEGVGEPVVVTDGEEQFAVFADAFGWAVLRAPRTGGAAEPIAPAGTIETVPHDLAGIPEVTGWAPVASGLVATSALSHAVLFTRPRR